MDLILDMGEALMPMVIWCTKYVVCYFFLMKDISGVVYPDMAFYVVQGGVDSIPQYGTGGSSRGPYDA